MSCYLIEYKDNQKVMVPVTTREKYLQLRSLAVHADRVRRVREGDISQKSRLQQFNYSCIPGEDGKLKGCTQMSTSVGMDIDLSESENESENRYHTIRDLILDGKDELGLLLLERSVTKGYHIVFRRHPEMSQEENLHWASDLIGVPFDPAAKDITRVFFATTASEEDLIFLSPDLFNNQELENLRINKSDKNLENNEGNNSPNSKNFNNQDVEEDKIKFSNSLILDKKENDYQGIPYSTLVSSLEDLLGGAPAHGSRNNFIFTMAAYLRYVCNDDPKWIASVLPTYGEARDKWYRTIQSACQRSQYKVMPQIVKRAIANAKAKALPLGGDGEGSLPPEMPQRLPRLIAHLVKNVPEVCRPAVANAVFPALAAHLNGVKFWLIDGTEKEATFMCVTMAKQSSGKSAVNKPIEYIVADIVERDEINRRREQEWKDATAQKGANKEKPKRPDDICVQVLVSDMTNAAFVQRMKDAGGKYLYTNLEELDLLKQLQTNGTKDVGKIICLCFDNGKYGQERVGTQSVTARVDLRWNWNAATTIQKGINFFKGRMVDGTLSRINFCTIVPDKTKDFVYGRYDEDYAETLKPFITNLNLANGHIECPEALVLARRLLEKCQDEGALTDDDVYQDMAYRAVTIAYLKAMVLYIANDMNWSDDIAEFMAWSLDYDLWCKCHFFGEKISEDKAKEDIKRRRGPKNLLDLLPEAFSEADAQEVRKLQGLPEEGCKSMISTWMNRGYIELDTTSGKYLKTERYLSRQNS